MFKKYQIRDLKPTLGYLNDTNHISAYPQKEWHEFNPEYYSVDQKLETTTQVEHTITGWKDRNNDTPEVIVYSDSDTDNWKDGEIVWEPFIEMLLREQVFSLGITNYVEGYIDGLYHHLGFYGAASTIGGYTFWQSYNLK